MDFDPIAYMQEPRWGGSRLGLERVRELLERLGRPQDRLRFVHVAGTNGKGSVCAYAASMLRAAGYRTGSLTSPYLERFEEQIRVDGASISLDELREVTCAVRAAAEAMADHPTEFELICAAALLHFAQRACDIAVLEVGLGGRFDATNVIDAPEVCAITKIGLDHTELLGDTVRAVAWEKVGIVKRGASVVTCAQDPEARLVIEGVCLERHAPLSVVDGSQLVAEPLALCLQHGDRQSALPVRRFSYRGRSFETALLATYQPENAALALEAMAALREKGWNVSEQAERKGIAAMRWPGRFEVVGDAPLTIVDGGHNPQGVRALVETLREVLPGVRPVFVFGVLADKDYPAMVEEVVDCGSAFVTVTPNSPRALSAEGLASVVRGACEARGADPSPKVVVSRDMREAVATARELAGSDGVVCAFGSLYSINAFKEAIHVRFED